MQLENDLNKHEEGEERDLHVIRDSKSYPGFGDVLFVLRQRRYRIDQKKFKEWYLHYFGLHSVAVAGCIMYAPYAAPLVFAIIHLLFFGVAAVMQSCSLVGATRVVFRVLMTIAVLMDVCLLFSVTMGVGASGYDSNLKNCYLL